MPMHSERHHHAGEQTAPIKIFMMDLWATVPYYDAYLCRALLGRNVQVTLGSITYYLDRECFSKRGLRNSPGLLDVVGKFQLPKSLRRPLKFAEAMLNMFANAVRMLLARPDVIHVQFLPLLKWGLPLESWFLLYCRRLGIKIVYTVHDLVPHDTGERYQDRFRRLYRLMDALIAHSESAKQRLIADFGIAPERIWVIPHGPFFYDCASLFGPQIRAKYNIRPDESLVLWQGLIFPYKGLEFLLDSWVNVQKAGTKARLVIAGTGNSEILSETMRRAELLGISDSVTFDLRFLPLEELTSLYDAADIVVYPYKAVTTSGALLTGIGLGKAIITTDLAPFSEMLEHGKNALLVKYGNIEELAAAILRLINEPETRRALGARVRGLSYGDNAWKAIAQQTELCYFSVLQGKRAQA